MPSHIPYEVIRNACLHTIQTIHPSSTVDDVVIQKTLIEREEQVDKLDKIWPLLSKYMHVNCCGMKSFDVLFATFVSNSAVQKNESMENNPFYNCIYYI